MNKAIESLREALKFSPNNIPLKLHLAQTLYDFNYLDDAEIEFQELIKLENNETHTLGLAKVFYAKKEFGKCTVILEDIFQPDTKNISILELYTKTLIQENNLDYAAEVYKIILGIDRTYSDEFIDSHLRVRAEGPTNEEISEDVNQNLFMEKPSINFHNVGGLEHVKKEIDLKIIKPLQHAELYKQYGKKIGGGILLYGPPGCGKTFMAKATAGEINSKFISVGLNDILDMWVGSSEKNLHEIFETARGNNPCVLFFDEIDALGASRTDMRQSSSRLLINQFLQELDGVVSNNEGILVVGATNTPWHLDAAFRRPGRFDRIIFIPPPDTKAREAIFKLKLAGKPIENIDYEILAKNTKEYSGADIEAVIDIAIEEKLTLAMEEGIPKPMSTKDLKKAIKKHKPSTKEWFVTARNHALYANQSELYDEVLSYLNIKK
ncbi:AAA family ATPase [Aureivirga sp. CE67]|uniref:AAA family ATPase n=1 Tax=Aureivirga sp. CE67 TaxID=1788983 RepID=UPI0018C944A6|nr:AAA family ATPase [Aureivirga sp. CE67]